MSETINTNQLLEKAQALLQEIEVEQLQQELSSLQAQTLEPDFWQRSSAQEIMQQISRLNQRLEQAEHIQQLKQDIQTYQSLIKESQDESAQQQAEQELDHCKNELQQLVNQLSIKKFLSGKFDKQPAIVSIHPGQGGTEAMDWAQMLSRMYQHYFERKNWQYQFLNEIKGEEAGIKEVSFEVKAPYAYGYLKTERGTHRLVRLSPFNADNLRQTSFALVEVIPVVTQDQEIKIKDEDLSWHFTRAGGPGGQSVNKTNSAVELTHEPTGITVKSRQAKSQVANKKTALKLLKAQLAARLEAQQEKQVRQEKGQHRHASWGTQIRNYVLHPYQLVKDTRTDVETRDTQAVLDGDLDQFIEEAIKLQG